MRKILILLAFSTMIASAKDTLTLQQCLTRGIENFDARLVSWEVLEPILCLAVLCSSLAFSLWAMAIKKLGVGKSSVFLAMMCVATALVAEVIGREHLSLFQWLGVLIAVLGIVLSQYCCTKNCKVA